MRANEFIYEDVGDLTPDQKGPMKASKMVRDKGGYDRIYYINRLGMAMAMANGKDTKPVDMDTSSWVEKFNSVHAYTPEEESMIDAAIATIPTEAVTGVTSSKSEEPLGIHKISPVKGFKGYSR